MRVALITQREGRDRYGTEVDNLEQTYIRFAESLGYPIYPPAPLPRGERRSKGNGENRMRRMEKCREQIREHIDYESLQATHPYDMERIDGYVELMAEVCCSGKSTVRINQEDMPIAMAKERFLSLDREHILYVLECMDKTASQIGNIRAYTLSALYNAPVTMEQYYAALVNHDLAAG